MSENNSHKLADVALREIRLDMDKTHQTSDWSGEVDAEMIGYAAEDSRILHPVRERLQEKVAKAGLTRALEIEQRALPTIVRMAKVGVPFDSDGWREHLEEIENGKAGLLEELRELAPEKPGGGEWNWNSPAQVKDAFALVGASLADTEKSTIAHCSHPLAKSLLEYRRANTTTVNYGKKLLDRVENGRIHASWRQMGAQTGRMACSSPNLQNLPPSVRRHVRASEGRVLVKADYSQIELRIAAKIAGDRRMLEAFANGDDIHTITARSLVGHDSVSAVERKLAKAVNFGLLYGMGSNTLKSYSYSNYGVEMMDREAKKYRRKFFGTYSGLRSWHSREKSKLKRGSTETRTLTGRRRTGVTKFTERLNSPVQGTGADGIKVALGLLHERREECPGAFPILVVHDEIVVECDEADAENVKAWLERAMVDGMEDVLDSGSPDEPRVPVVVDVTVADSWEG